MTERIRALILEQGVVDEMVTVVLDEACCVYGLAKVRGGSHLDCARRADDLRRTVDTEGSGAGGYPPPRT
jgi:hypothetical protein